MKAIKNSQIIAKTLYYRSDGTGKIISSRDDYINKDNGGYIKQHFSKSPPEKKPGPFIYSRPRPQTAIADSRIKHYISDGTGRDSYIAQLIKADNFFVFRQTNGGQSSYYICNTNNVNTFFNNNLRSYPRMGYCTQQDFYSVAQGLKSKQEFYKHSRLIKPQKDLTQRLSQPKQQIFLCTKDKIRRSNLNVMGRSMQLLQTQDKYQSKRL